MATYSQRLYHIVYGTKNRQPTLESEQRRRLKKWITQSRLSAIDGTNASFGFTPQGVMTLNSRG